MRAYNPLIVLTLTLVTGCTSAAKHYRIHCDGPSFYRVMYKDIRNGDSLERVRSFLGPGVTECDQDRYRDITRKFIQRVKARSIHPNPYPDGINDEDLFVKWQIGPKTYIYLQFRENRLVNHIPQEFAEHNKPFTAVAQ